jgi:hypothetical protein
MDTINSTDPVSNNNTVVVDETDLSDVDVDIERDLLPIRQGTADDKSEALYKELVMRADKNDLSRFRTSQEVWEFIEETSCESLKYCCDKIEGLFQDHDDDLLRRAKRAASEDPDESPSKRVRLAVSGILQEAIYEREGMPPAARGDKAGMRREPEVDVVAGDWGMAFRGRKDIYYRTFHGAGGVDASGSSCTQQKTADPDDDIGLVALFAQYASKEDLMGEEGRELMSQIKDDWDKVKVVEERERRVRQPGSFRPWPQHK